MTEEEMVSIFRTLTGERRVCLIEAALFCLHAESITQTLVRATEKTDDAPTAAESPRAKRLRPSDRPDK